MKLQKATRKYERWLDRHCEVVRADLVRKHQVMRQSAFTFFRGTFYRWMQVWPDVCPVLAKAPTVPAVGDLHVENFGTWRDVEGRLIWGINDFDECAPLAYTNDLVRLGASAVLAAREAKLSLTEVEIASALLKGYRLSLTAGGLPFVLDGRHHWLRHAAMGARRPPAQFWTTLTSLPPATRFPGGVKATLREALPKDAGPIVWKRRVAGVGSLGRPRLVALAAWRGSIVAREAKSLLPSAALWAEGDRRARTYCAETVDGAVRSWDPTLHYGRRWIVRRLAPDCSRVEMADLAHDRDERRLLTAMGAETANVHLGDRKACKAVAKHLPRLNPSWLSRAARQMADEMTRDWEAF